MPQCKRAEMCLCLGDKTINYSWQSKELRQADKGYNFVTDGDHSYAAKLPNTDDDEEFLDLDYSKIFDSEGNWQAKHKRSIINIMDSFRISHEAYHEVRMAGKGHYPPLHHIIAEKSVMSEVIPYIKHPTVSEN